VQTKISKFNVGAVPIKKKIQVKQKKKKKTKKKNKKNEKKIKKIKKINIELKAKRLLKSLLCKQK